MTEFTHILSRVDQGDSKAAEELLPLVYDELRRLAAQKMAHEAAGQTLQPTALVHEAWLRLAGGENNKWDCRAHFFAAAAEAMRRILIDNARRKNAQKRGSGSERVDLDSLEVAADVDDTQLLCINDALEVLARRALTMRTLSPLSVCTTTSNFLWCDCPTEIHRFSNCECAGSEIVSERTSPNTIAASSKPTPCRKLDSGCCR